MVRSKLLSGRYSGTRVELIHRQQQTHHSSKVTSFEQNRTIPSPPQEILFSYVRRSQSDMTTSTESNGEIFENNNKYNQLKYKSQQNSRIWLDPVKIMCSILGILLLTVLILPSIFIYVLAPKYSSTGLSQSSTQTNHCAGVSSNSLWTLDTATILTMTLDTSQCNFKKTPLYFVSMAGLANHFCLIGYAGIYVPTKESFQIYVEATCGGWNGTNFLDAAQTNAWAVNWMGFYQ